MRNPDFSHLECSLAKTLGLVGEWWTLLIIRDLFYGLRRFDAIRRDLGIARNVLTDRLRKLEDRGLVERRRYQDKPERFEYRLTLKGKDLYGATLALMAWADRWEAPAGPPVVLRHGSDGHAIEPVVVCGRCGGPLRPREVKAVVGPGAQRLQALPTPLRPGETG